MLKKLNINFLLIIPTFEENGIYIFGVIFFLLSIFADWNKKTFNKKIYTPLKISTTWVEMSYVIDVLSPVLTEL